MLLPLAVLIAPIVFPGAGEPVRLPPPPRVLEPSVGDEEWLQFNVSDTPEDAPTKASVSRLRKVWRVQLPEAVDGSPAYVRRVPILARERDLVIVTTTRGRMVALDARRGTIEWQTSPPPGPQWTTSSPAIDPDRDFVYGYALDGRVHKYDITDGTEVTIGGWPQLVTLKPDVEKGSSALSIVTTGNGSRYLYMTTAGYPEPDPGDQGDYQGHLVAINLATGRQNVFNSACSDKAMHFVENGDETNDCTNVQSGIWARAGTVYDEVTDRVFVTTGNGAYDADRGGYNWGSSVIALRPDGSTDGGTPLDSYTPTDYQLLTDIDADLGSTTVAILASADTSGRRLAIQSGKDGRVRFLDLRDLSGAGGPGHIGGELGVIEVPQRGPIFTRPASWLDSSGRTWVYLANGRGLSASILVVDEKGPHLDTRWTEPGYAESPVIVNGVLYFAGDHRVAALDPETGETLWEDRTIGGVHWQSPIVANQRLFITDNDGGVFAFAIRPAAQ
ncbi:MAG: outer membrane protein assembly factor BamB family protein [Thermoanaerobaculia bacterium]